jgi:hypothetical protein
VDAIDAARHQLTLIVEGEAEDRGFLADMVEIDDRLQQAARPSLSCTDTLAVTGTGKC